MKAIKIIFGRLAFILIAAALEVYITISIFKWFNAQATWIETALRVLSIVIVLAINKNSKHLSSDIMWIILIIAFPVPSTVLYLLLGANVFTSRTFRQISESTAYNSRYYNQNPKVMKKLEDSSPEYKGQFHYISQYAGYPFYKNTGFEYYGMGEDGFPEILKELRKAKKFIFLEYFIIEEGQMWNSVLEILEEKVKDGVDVRVMYDDLGSFFTLSGSYARKLEEKGIKCLPFNRINPVISIVLNHRDHRKIMVIDGKVAFSGGINLADEYINVKHRFGVWKDNVFKVTGEAVWSYTVMFLTHWNALRNEDYTFLSFKAEPIRGKNDGYIAPYGETPLDDEITAQNIYTSIIHQSNNYCYISTPYLIIDTEMKNTLILAAKSGVDVRIITPGIPDKKIVFSITRSYYRQLIEGGVKIIEYTPGFIHSKIFVSDDIIATVGTVNLDYRSLYLHFENGTYLYNSSKIKDIKKDLDEAIAVGHEVTLEECSHSLIKEFLLSILRLFAPLI